jgi:hypothetical protein
MLNLYLRLTKCRLDLWRLPNESAPRARSAMSNSPLISVPVYIIIRIQIRALARKAGERR